jgi:hypothetical protein
MNTRLGIGEEWKRLAKPHIEKVEEAAIEGVDIALKADGRIYVGYDDHTNFSDVLRDTAPDNLEGGFAHWVGVKLEYTSHVITPDQAKWFALGALAHAHAVTRFRELTEE